MSHDPDCHELAERFLKNDQPDVPESLINELAEEIQTTIEDFMQYGESYTNYKKWRNS